jgi:hypothetical protein
MTIYFDKRAEVEQAEEAAAVEEKQQKELAKQEASKALAFLLSTFVVKPFIFMLLWNWLVPSIFGLAAIGYLKALGLYMLTRIIIDKND